MALFREPMASFPAPFFPVPGNHDGLWGELDHYLIYSGARFVRLGVRVLCSG